MEAYTAPGIQTCAYSLGGSIVAGLSGRIVYDFRCKSGNPLRDRHNFRWYAVSVKVGIDSVPFPGFQIFHDSSIVRKLAVYEATVLWISWRVPLHQAALLQEYQVGSCVGGFCDTVELTGTTKHTLLACQIVPGPRLDSNNLLELCNCPGNTSTLFCAVVRAWGENAVEELPVCVTQRNDSGFFALTILLAKATAVLLACFVTC